MPPWIMLVPHTTSELVELRKPERKKLIEEDSSEQERELPMMEFIRLALPLAAVLPRRESEASSTVAKADGLAEGEAFMLMEEDVEWGELLKEGLGEAEAEGKGDPSRTMSKLSALFRSLVEQPNSAFAFGLELWAETAAIRAAKRRAV
jgi:hypothetical protein